MIPVWAQWVFAVYVVVNISIATTTLVEIKNALGGMHETLRSISHHLIQIRQLLEPDD